MERRLVAALHSKLRLQTHTVAADGRDGQCSLAFAERNSAVEGVYAAGDVHALPRLGVA